MYINTAAESHRATNEMVCSGKPGLGSCNSSGMPEVEEETARVFSGQPLPPCCHPDGIGYTRLGANLSISVRKQRCSRASFAISSEPARPPASVSIEVPLHEVIRAER